MHDVAVALDVPIFGDPHRARLADSTEIVAAEVDEHQMLGILLLVGQ